MTGLTVSSLTETMKRMSSPTRDMIESPEAFERFL